MRVQTLLYRVLEPAGYLRPLKVPGYAQPRLNVFRQPFLRNSCVCVRNERIN